MMEQDKKNGTGAPSTDTTSALFVSQRKKQLEQQEADRRAREKEEQRQAAEAEVRRLEQEVEDRKRKAEEEAKHVAEEARAKKAEAQVNPDAVLGAAQPAKEKKELKLPGLSKSAPAGDGTAAAKPLDMKKLAIIGGAVVVVLAIIIIIAVSSGGGKGASASSDLIPYSSSQKGISFMYPTRWQMDDASAEMVTIASEELGAFAIFMDITNEVNQMTEGGIDIVTAVETMLQGMAEGVVGGTVAGLEPQLQKSGSLVTGSAIFTYQDADLGETDVDMSVTAKDNRIIVDILATADKDKAETARADYQAIMGSLEIVEGESAGATTADSPSESSASTMTAPAGYKTFSSSNGLAMICPENWSIQDSSGNMRRSVVAINNADESGFMLVANYADEATGLVGQDIYNLFLEDAQELIELDFSMASNVQEVKGERVGDRMESYSQWASYPGGIDVFFSVVIYNDDKGTVQGVVIGHGVNDQDTLDKMSAIMESIDVA